MADDGEVEKLRIGRQNVIRLAQEGDRDWTGDVGDGSPDGTNEGE